MRDKEKKRDGTRKKEKRREEKRKGMHYRYRCIATIPSSMNQATKPVVSRRNEEREEKKKRSHPLQHSSSIHHQSSSQSVSIVNSFFLGEGIRENVTKREVRRKKVR